MAGDQTPPAGPENPNVVDKRPTGQGPYHNLVVLPDGTVTGFRSYSHSPPPVTVEAERQNRERVAREQALYDHGAPVAGHDFAKEWRDRTTDDRSR